MDRRVALADGHRLGVEHSLGVWLSALAGYIFTAGIVFKLLHLKLNVQNYAHACLLTSARVCVVCVQ